MFSYGVLELKGLVEQGLELAPQAEVLRQQNVFVEANADYYNS